MSFVSAASLTFGLRCLQLVPNGVGGTLMSLDFLHKQVRRDFVEKMRFPAWLRKGRLLVSLLVPLPTRTTHSDRVRQHSA